MENKIIKLIKKKDHRGIDYIVDLYSDKISYIVNSILKGYSNKEDIEECISDVFISVYNDIHTYDNKKGKFETFVFIKAKYIALDYKRKIIKKKEYEKIKEDRLLKINENIAYESAEKEVIKKEKLKDIANFINNLKEPDKTYFYLKYFIAACTALYSGGNRTKSNSTWWLKIPIYVASAARIIHLWR